MGKQIIAYIHFEWENKHYLQHTSCTNYISWLNVFWLTKYLSHIDVFNGIILKFLGMHFLNLSTLLATCEKICLFLWSLSSHCTSDAQQVVWLVCILSNFIYANINSFSSKMKHTTWKMFNNCIPKKKTIYYRRTTVTKKNYNYLIKPNKIKINK